MPNKTGNIRNFQIYEKKRQPWEIDQTFWNKFLETSSVPSDFEPEFPEIFVEWNAPRQAWSVPKVTAHLEALETFWQKVWIQHKLKFQDVLGEGCNKETLSGEGVDIFWIDTWNKTKIQKLGMGS